MIEEITPQQAQERQQGGALLVDVREAEEYRAVHAAGARLLPLSELEARANELPRQELLMICRSGARSLRAAEYLAAQGHRVFNVSGGTNAWAEAGLPTAEGEA